MGFPQQNTSRRRRHEKKSIKYRLSCDRCAESKVRCDREKPFCQRCLKHELPCNYSISLRMGKIAASKALAIRSKNMVDHTEKVPSPMRAPRSQTSFSPGPSECIAPLYCSSHSAARDFSPQALAPFLHEEYTPSLDVTTSSFSSSEASVDSFQHGSQIASSTFAPSSAQQLMGMPNLTMGLSPISDSAMLTASDSFLGDMLPYEASPRKARSFQLPGDYVLNVSNAGKHLVPLPQMGNTSATQMDKGPDISTKCPENACMKIANFIHEKLSRFLQEPPHTNTTKPRPSFDEAVHASTQVTQQLANILQCPYDEDACLPYIISTTISKLLDMYGTMGSTPNTASGPFFRRPPVSMGGYMLDDNQAEILHAQLTREEVRKASQIIETFGNAFCTCTGAGASDASHREISLVLLHHMRTKLRKTIDSLSS